MTDPGRDTSIERLMATSPQSRLPAQRFLLSLALMLLLAAGIQESTHLHQPGLDTPECVQCQFEPGQAIAGQTVPAAVFDLDLMVAFEYTPLYLLSDKTTCLPRGPPFFST